MTLDLTKISLELDALAGETLERKSTDALRELAMAYHAVDSYDLAARLRTAKTSWLLAHPAAAFQFTSVAPEPPTDYTLVASDGSFILPDRHSPARFFVINIGKVVLRYGSDPFAEIEAEPNLFFGEDGLYVPDNVRRIPVNGAVLGFKRAAEELESVARVAVTQESPTVALQDGTLILWGLESQAEPVVNWVLAQYLHALDTLKNRGIPVASYISYPASNDVVNSVRVSVCDYPDRGIRSTAIIVEVESRPKTTDLRVTSFPTSTIDSCLNRSHDCDQESERRPLPVRRRFSICTGRTMPSISCT